MNSLRAGLCLATAAILAPGAFAQDLDPEPLTQPADVEYAEPTEELIARGEELYNDASLGTSGNACMTCHADFANYNDTFKAPYPHFVQMAQSRAGMDEVTAAEMVQLCMVVPMMAEPLDWESPEMRALVAYVKDERERFASQ